MNVVKKVSDRLAAKQQRIEACNDFLFQIASCGRKFFSHNHLVAITIAKFKISDNGKIWLFNEWSLDWIYVSQYRHGYKGFTHGGTLTSWIRMLVEYIKTGRQINSNLLDSHWGYGDDIYLVINKGKELGILI